MNTNFRMLINALLDKASGEQIMRIYYMLRGMLGE